MYKNGYFTRSEFTCKCGCGFDVMDSELLTLLNHLREYFNSPITITSGCRCTLYNAKIRGSIRSMHRHGKAVDFVVKDVDPKTVQEYLDQYLPADKYGLGYGATFTHLDVRAEAARFSY